MTPRHSVFAVAGLVSVLSSGASSIAVGSSPVGIDPDARAALRSQAPVATNITLFVIHPRRKATDLGTAAGDLVFYQAPKGPAFAITDGQWRRVGAGEVSGPLGPQVGMALPAQVASGSDGGDGLVRGRVHRGWGRQPDDAEGEGHPALLVGMTGPALDLDPGVQLGVARCDLDQRQTEGLGPGGASEGNRLRQAAQGVQEVAIAAVDRPVELVGLDAGGAQGQEEQIVRMIKSWAWPPWK